MNKGNIISKPSSCQFQEQYSYFITIVPRYGLRCFFCPRSTHPVLKSAINPAISNKLFTNITAYEGEMVVVDSITEATVSNLIFSLHCHAQLVLG